MRLRRLLASFVVLLSVVLLPLSLAQQQSPAPTQSPLPTPTEYPDYAAGHIIAVRSSTTLTAQLPPEAARNVHAVSKFLRYLDRAINSNIEKQSNGSAEAGKVETRTCNMQDNNWGSAASAYLELRGVQPCDKSCSTQREFSSKSVHSTVNELRPALQSWAKQLNETASKIGRNLVGTLGTNALAGVGRFVYPDRDAQNCTLWHTMAVRVQSKWYVQARVTAKAVNPDGARWDSHYLIEHVHAKSDKEFGPPLRLFVPRDNTSVDRIIAFTTNETFERPAPDSIGVSPDVSRNLAFKAALNKGDNEYQQAIDAIQYSNVAILILPLAMNLVPVALIADVNTLGMLMYTALTDVLTTIPLCIKGVELISIANDNFHAVSAQVAGKFGAKETAVAEVWVSQCHLRGRVWLRRLGVIFVVVSVTLMVFGVACEFVARAWVKRRRRQNGDPLLANEQTHGASSSYQPFTAAALTLQNRMPSAARGIGGGNAMPPPPPSGYSPHYAAAYPGSSGAHASRSPQLGLLSSTQRPQQQHAVYPSAAGPSSAHAHAHGENCRCACHSATHAHGRAHEYDARPYPDLLSRKYH